MQLRFEHRTAVPCAELFRFHEHPANLARLLEGWPGFRILRHEDSIRVGAEVWVEQTFARCVPIVLGFRHTHYDPPRSFAEELIHGPFRHFRHVHEFVADGEEATIVRDRLEFSALGIFGGETGTRLFVEPFVRAMFRVRGAGLDRLARAQRHMVPA